MNYLEKVIPDKNNRSQVDEDIVKIFESLTPDPSTKEVKDIVKKILKQKAE